MHLKELALKEKQKELLEGDLEAHELGNIPNPNAQPSDLPKEVKALVKEQIREELKKSMTELSEM